jgi:hypothetical protein
MGLITDPIQRIAAVIDCLQQIKKETYLSLL